MSQKLRSKYTDRFIGVPNHTLPSKLDIPATHPALVKSIESQRYKKTLRELQENEEIENGQVETVVYNLQSHMKLILRLIKATYKSLEEYKKEAQSLRSEIFRLRQKLIEENEDVLNELNPELVKNYKTLKKQMKEQKTDTELKYKELLKLKKSISQSQQLLDNEVVTLSALQGAILGNANALEEEH